MNIYVYIYLLCPPWRHGAFCVSRQTWRTIMTADSANVTQFTSGASRAISHANDTQKQAPSGWKSSPGKIFHRNSSGARTPTWNSAQATEKKLRSRENIALIAERRQRRQQETEATATKNTYKGSDKILQLHCKWNRRRAEHRRIPTLQEKK